MPRDAAGRDPARGRGAPPAPSRVAAAAPRPQPVMRRAVHVAAPAAAAPQRVAAQVPAVPVVSSLGGFGGGTLAPPVPIARAAAATLTSAR